MVYKKSIKKKKKKLKISKLILKKSIFFFKKKLVNRIKSFLLFRNKTKIEQKYFIFKNYYKELGFKSIQNNANFENEKLEEILEEYDELPDERKKKFLKKLTETLQKMPSSIVFIKDFLNIEEEVISNLNIIENKKIIFNLDDFLIKKKIAFIDNYNLKAWSKYNKINKNVNFIISNKIKFLIEKKIKKNQNGFFIKNFYQFNIIKKKILYKIKILYKFKHLNENFKNIINYILKSSLIKFFYNQQLFNRRNNIKSKFYKINLNKNIFIKKLFYDKTL